jgi:medium-chain acyl-[acyl-carrier-protein] hydrolase
MAYLKDLSGSAGGFDLVCFPHAGAGASAFREWTRLLGGDARILGVTMPGRESRIGEAPHATVDSAVAAIAREIVRFEEAERVAVPLALYGHSIGAILAFETAHSLAPKGIAVSHLFVGAQHPPQSAGRAGSRPYDAEHALEALAELHGNGSSQASRAFRAALEDRGFRETVEQILAADLTLGDSYAYEARPRLECAVTALGGTGDPYVGEADLDGWREHTSGHFTVRMVEGGHFFLHDAAPALCDVIARLLSRTSP